MTGRAADWPWSSFQATAGLVPAPEWLSVDWILGQFGETRPEAQAHYHRFVGAGPADGRPWDALVGGMFLGGEGFAEKLEPLLADRRPLAEIPRAQRFAGRPPLASLFTPPETSNRAERIMKMRQAHLDFGYTLKEIADFLGVHYATVSRAVKQIDLDLLDCKT
jgi:hypothetical protein